MVQTYKVDQGQPNTNPFAWDVAGRMYVALAVQAGGASLPRPAEAASPASWRCVGNASFCVWHAPFCQGRGRQARMSRSVDVTAAGHTVGQFVEFSRTAIQIC